MTIKKLKNGFYTINFENLSSSVRYLETLERKYSKEFNDLWYELQDLKDPNQELIELKDLEEVIYIFDLISVITKEIYTNLKRIEDNIKRYGSTRRSKNDIEEIQGIVVKIFESLNKAYELANKMKDIIVEDSLIDLDSNLMRKVEQVIRYILEIDESLELIEFTNETTGETGYIGPDGIYFDD